MKKQLIALPIAVALIGTNVLADATFKTDGSARVRLEGKKNGSDFSNGPHDTTRFIGSRFRLGMMFNPESNMDVYVQPQFNHVWGAEGTSGDTTSNPTLGMHQAFVNWRGSDMWEFKAGRQELSYGDEVVIGTEDWSNIGNVFDAAKVRVKYNMGWTDLFWSSIEETNSTTADAADFTGDHEIWGLYNSWDFGSNFKNVDLYFLSDNDSTTGVKTTIFDYGLRLKSDLHSFDYRIEYTGQVNNGKGERQTNIELGITFVPASDTRFSVEWTYASENYDQLYTSSHEFLGVADLIGRRNTNSFRFGLGSKLGDAWHAQLDYHMFKRAKDDVAAYGVDGTTAYTSTSDEKSVASEFDLMLNYKMTEKTYFQLGGALANPGNYLKDAGMEDKVTFYYVGMGTSF